MKLVHLDHWAQEYERVADFFDEGLTTLLDIGCGTGLELKAIYRRFPKARVTGIDLSEAMLAKLREKYACKEIQLLQADYFVYPFEENKYSAALAFETLHHFRYDKKQEIYHKLFQALRPGGCYVECDYVACCQEEEEICLAEYERRRARDKIPETEFVHIDIPLTLEHEIQLIQSAGFTTVKTLYQNGSTAILRAEKSAKR